MEDWNGVISKSSGFGGRSIKSIEDFEEEDVWDAVNETEDHSRKLISSGSSSAWRNMSGSTAPRMIPRRTHTGSTTNEAKVLVQPSSAPMEIPDWSKIYGKNAAAKTVSWADNNIDNDIVDYRGGDDVDDDEPVDDDDGMVPPHEWIAKKLARNQISSFSVCEGIGRTLKGRDLSKVRNAILTKTGFLE